MPRCRTTLAGPALRRLLGAALLALVLTALPAVRAADGKPETKPVTPPPAAPALHLHVPANVDDLKNLEKQVKVVTEKVTTATVGLEVGGSSGGPLFDLDGKVIGIHSRIGGTISTNIHVPVDTYRDTWDRLAKSEVLGTRLGVREPVETPSPYLGLTFGEKTQVDKIDA